MVGENCRQEIKIRMSNRNNQQRSRFNRVKVYLRPVVYKFMKFSAAFKGFSTEMILNTCIYHLGRLENVY